MPYNKKPRSALGSAQKPQLCAHPYFFAVAAVLYFYVYNLTHFELPVILRPLLFTLAVVIVTLQLLTRFFGSRRKAGLVTSFGLMVVSSFGYLYDVKSLEGYDLLTSDLGSDEIKIFGGYFLFLLGGLWFFARRQRLFAWTYFMNLFAFFAVAMPIGTILVVKHQNSQVPQPAGEDLFDLEQPVSNQPRRSKPDIYFIVLDGYGRSDNLKEYLSYDDSEFIQHLRKRGFWVSDSSNANYSLTIFSIGATLNYRYLPELKERKRFLRRDMQDIRRLLRRNRTSIFLKKEGYSLVAFVSQYYNLNLRSPDVSLDRWWFANEFEIGLLQRTPFPWILRKAGVTVIQDWHRAMVRFTLENLPRAAALESPKFVFAHILPPHPPFLFGPEGEDVNPLRRYDWSDGLGYLKAAGATRAGYRQGYVGQAEFVAKRVEKIVDQILQNSRREPIIILQSDHGPSLDGIVSKATEQEAVRVRLGMLNAAYLPNGENAFYEGMSPVNTFRVIFNHYFGTSYELLEDRHYMSTPGVPYDFVPVTIETRE